MFKFSKNKLPRLTSWWVIALLLSLLVFYIAPQQLPVSIYKLNLIALAAVSGYWIDRSVFFYARPRTDALRVLDDPVEEAEAVEHEGPDGAELLVAVSNTPALYFMLGCMLRRALIMAAAIVAVSLGA